MSSTEDTTTGGDPAVESNDDVLADTQRESAAVAEGEFDGTPDPDSEGLVDPAVVAAERDDYRDTLLRLKAEFDNYRKRAAREEIEVRERAASALVDKLLVVLDACDAAIGHGAVDVEPISKILLELLERDGLERMTPEGSPFDPKSHEAVLHEPGDGGESVVVEVLRTGYVWKGRVLRPAMVKVRG